MFHLTKRLFVALCLAWLALGLVEAPWLIPLPAAAVLAFLLRRHRYIQQSIGISPLCSDGFARHVLVDDLIRLAGLMLLAPLFYFAGAGFSG